ncbi:MAG: hypothetical protein IKZ82_06545 [Clostridia bacterium]|nr:hypothetical protein [Clostridia bacterium]
MSLKTCKLLQTIAVCLFALAFLLVLLSVPLKNTLIRLVYPREMLSTLDESIFRVSVFPTISFIAVLICLGISVVHLTVLKTSVKKYVLASVIFCSVVFFLHRVFTPAINDYFTNRAILRSGEDDLGYYNAYALLENALYNILPCLTAAGSILMFLSFGGSIGKGADEAKSEEESDKEGDDAQNALPAILEASAQRPSENKTITLAGLDEPETAEPIDPAAYHAAFKRPSGSESERSDLPPADDPEAYRRAFQRPKNDE